MNNQLIETAKQNIETHRELREAILEPTDYRTIPQDNKQNINALTHTAYQKLAKAYNITQETQDKHRETNQNTYTWHFTVQATTPNGQKATGEGCCTNTEPGIHTEHDTKTQAHIRAINRAISNLIDYGTKSAEEYSSAPQIKDKPHEPSEETTRIITTLEANGYNPNTFQITEQTDSTSIKPLNMENWESIDKILKHLNATWNQQTQQWIIPHDPTNQPTEPQHHIWTIAWKTRDKQPIQDQPEWAWAYAYNTDGTHIPEHQQLVQHIEQNGPIQTEGYTVSLGGRGKKLLQLRQNKGDKKPG